MFLIYFIFFLLAAMVGLMVPRIDPIAPLMLLTDRLDRSVDGSVEPITNKPTHDIVRDGDPAPKISGIQAYPKLQN